MFPDPTHLIFSCFSCISWSAFCAFRAFRGLYFVVCGLLFHVKHPLPPPLLSALSNKKAQPLAELSCMLYLSNCFALLLEAPAGGNGNANLRGSFSYWCGGYFCGHCYASSVKISLVGLAVIIDCELHQLA